MYEKISLPLSPGDVRRLGAGDQVLLSGELLVARDAAHKRLVTALDAGDELPVELCGQTIYYMGPSPARPGAVIGAAGPTTSGRMDAYVERLLQAGLRGMIGKGMRAPEVVAAIQAYEAIYFAALGGAGALAARHIRASSLIAYQDLGAEALRCITVVDLPVTVINDCRGGDWYALGRQQYGSATT